MRIYKYILSSMSLLCGLFLTTSCSDKYEYETHYSYFKDVKISIAGVDENNILALHITPSINTYKVKINTDPENILIDPAAYTYKIEDTSIATIDQKSGTITMEKEGETKLMVSFRGNHDIYTDCNIKVIKDPIYIKEIKAPSEAFVEINKTINLAELITILPSNADNKKLSYVVEDETIASVDENGVVKGNTIGTTNIIVSTTDGSDISATISFEVKDKIEVESLDLGKLIDLQSKDLPIGQKFNFGKEITIVPEHASDKTLIYEITEGEGVAKIDENGMLEALSAGNATVQISSADGAVTETVSIKVSADRKDYERTLWSVATCAKYSTGLDYVEDNGKGKPEQLIDGKAETYLCLRKPEKLASGDQKYDYVYFIVDAGYEIPFNTIKYQHRQFNDWLAAKEIEVSGSNDGETFTTIKSGLQTPYGGNNIYNFNLDENVKYRYIKVTVTKWLVGSGTTLQIAEFSVNMK